MKKNIKKIFHILRPPSAARPLTTVVLLLHFIYVVVLLVCVRVCSEEDLMYARLATDPNLRFVGVSLAPAARRDAIANVMWEQYVALLAERGIQHVEVALADM